MNTHELAGVRDPGFKALPEDEQAAWRAFRREVEGWLPVDPGRAAYRGGSGTGRGMPRSGGSAA